MFELARKEKTERDRDKLRKYIMRRSTTTRHYNTLLGLRREMVCHNFRDSALRLALDNQIKRILDSRD